MNILYAHKKYLVEVVQLTALCDIEGSRGKIIGFPGDYLLTDQHGGQSIIGKEEFEQQYLPVTKKIDKLAMVKGYMEMGNINLEEANAGVHTYNEGFEGN